MQLGTVAFLDALGFKGIWRNHDARQVLAKFAAIEEAAKNALSPQERAEITISLRFFSDTVIICAPAPSAPILPELAQFDSLLRVTAAASRIASVAANPDPAPPIAFRGAISCGEYDLTDKFVIGQAIDDAAEAERLGQGALIWFTPSATRVFEAASERMKRDGPIAQRAALFMPALLWPVPLKGGDVYETWVVNPLSMAETTQAVGDGIMAAMDAPGLDVAIKRQNTSTFLVNAREAKGRVQRALVEMFEKAGLKPRQEPQTP